ncbi:MAG: hypothetical protein KGJ06_00800, partial [Pseudomonadota bacterium]|nr:hypothetical protein [Pseudomonadota bacterium]
RFTQALGNQSLEQLAPHNDHADSVLSGIIKDGRITTESVRAFDDNFNADRRLSKLIRERDILLSERQKQLSCYEKMRQALKEKYAGNDYILKRGEEYIKDREKRWPDITICFDNSVMIRDEDYKNLEKSTEQTLKWLKKDYIEFRKEEKKRHIEKARMVTQTLESFFGLKFSYHNKAYYTEIPLHDNETRHRIYSALSKVARYADDFPAEEELFINHRVVNHRGSKVSVPPDAPVPKLYEMRLPQHSAETLASLVTGEKLSCHNRYPQRFTGQPSEIPDYCHSVAEEMAQPWEELANTFRQLQALEKSGTWVNVAAFSRERDTHRR